VQKSVRGWTLTLPKQLPLWEMESRWTPEFLEGDCRGQNSMPWGVFYIIEKLLWHKYLKWAHITHLDIWNTSYGQKKGRKSNWQFDPQPLKVKKLTWFSYVQVACDILLERSQQGLQLCFRPRLHRRFARGVMGLQSRRNPNHGI